MREPSAALQTAEKIAGVIAMIAALVVLNGAWENQHNWENLSWRIAMVAVLLALAAVVETNALGTLQRWRGGEEGASVPEFLRTGGSTMHDTVSDEAVRIDAAATTVERR